MPGSLQPFIGGLDGNLKRKRFEDESEENDRRKAPNTVQRQDTDLKQFIDQMKAHPAPEVAIREEDIDFLNEVYIDAVKNDGTMKNLLSDKTESPDGKMDMAKPLCTPEFLQGEVHEIFRYENFAQASSKSPTNLLGIDSVIGEARAKELHATMRPAFLLATKLLQHTAMEDFWFHVMYGEPTQGEKKPYLKRSPLEDDKETARMDFRDLLLTLQDRMTFVWVPETLTSGSHNSTFWAAVNALRPDGELWYTIGARSNAGWYSQAPYQYSGHICLASDFIYHLISPGAAARRSKDAYARIQVKLGVTLAHELTHAINELCRFAYPSRFIRPTDLVAFSLDEGVKDVSDDTVRSNMLAYLQTKEREHFVYESDLANEVGWSFEHALWKGMAMDCAIGTINIGPMLAYRAGSEVERPSLRVFVKQDWLAALFGHGTWDAFEEHRALLHRQVETPDKIRVMLYSRKLQNFRIQDRDLGEGNPLRETLWRWWHYKRKQHVAEALRSRLFQEQTIVTLGCGAWLVGSVVRSVMDDFDDPPSLEECPWVYPDDDEDEDGDSGGSDAESTGGYPPYSESD